MIVFFDRVSGTIFPSWLRTTILLISASWVARIKVVSHQCPAQNAHLKRIRSVTLYIFKYEWQLSTILRVWNLTDNFSRRIFHVLIWSGTLGMTAEGLPPGPHQSSYLAYWIIACNLPGWQLPHLILSVCLHRDDLSCPDNSSRPALPRPLVRVS
jgi:hypothetical protein